MWEWQSDMCGQKLVSHPMKWEAISGSSSFMHQFFLCVTLTCRIDVHALQNTGAMHSRGFALLGNTAVVHACMFCTEFSTLKPKLHPCDTCMVAQSLACSQIMHSQERQHCISKLDSE